ncbi:MAG: magnesium-translocating P-type ATPase [Bdellovibrionota bacterium]
MWPFRKNTHVTNESPGQYRHKAMYLEVAKLQDKDLFRLFDSSPDGLSDDQVQTSIRRLGLNEIDRERFLWQTQLIKTFVNPFILLLTALAIVSYLTDDLRGALVMATMVVVSVCLTFFQEFRSGRAAERLKELVSTRATVHRRIPMSTASINPALRHTSLGRKVDVPINEIVPGDVIHLSAGDMIPADIRLFASKDLFVSQSALTGESLPLEKFSVSDTNAKDEMFDLRNLCFMGTNVISGTAMGIVLKTGKDTFIGSLAKSLSGQRVATSFDKGIGRFTGLMLKFMLIMVPAVFLINGFSKHQWYDAFMFAVAVAVGLTPEMLPMIVTVNLAKGALAMSKKKVIVKRLNSIQNFGAIDVLCTDKTGTLTQDNVVLEKYSDPVGNPVNRVLTYSYLNSYYQTGLKNLLDVAILKHHEVHGQLDIQYAYKKIDEIPFDFSRKRMSVIVERKNTTHVLICKGALEEIFSLCSKAEIDGKTIDIETVERERCQKYAQALNDDGLRVIAVAFKEMPKGQHNYSVKDESDLTLLGFVAFLDPPKESTPKAIQLLAAKGVKVKVLTGDNDRVTRKICSQVGLPFDKVVLGPEIEAMTDAQLDEAAEQHNVFAKLTPHQKERIIRALHRRGHVVGFMGDGINDAPALKAADIGISVDNAVDIAKESADIILLEKSLLVLEEGIIEGRKVFGNIVKYIKMGASSNFGNVFSMLGASAFLPFLPMQPVQLLTQNLLYDLSQTAIPLDHVDAEYLEKPRKWEINDIGRFMFFFGPISSLFDYATFAIMWFVFKANTPATAPLFQTGWFVEGLLSQTLIVHMIRTRKIPFIQSRAATPMILLTLTIMAIGVAIPFSGLGAKLGLVQLPGAYFVWLGAILLSYCVLTQTIKHWFVKKYGFN